MFRVGKIYVLRHSVRPAPHSISRQMSLTRKLLVSYKWQRPTSGRREPVSQSATSQLAARSAGNTTEKITSTMEQETTQSMRWPTKVFSGIQPTGSVHLGNYLGAVRKWLDLQKSGEHMTLCVVDMHSITMPHNPPLLRENIFTMAATLLACGIDPAKSTLFVQSAVLEHAELNWILSSLTTMPRLAQLPQFKDKSRLVRDVPLGLYVYPVLQAADIMLYKATHVPVGADQLQHLQLAQHLARTFNGRYGEMFPVCTPVIEEDDGSRILSLRDVSKKMSKSDPNPKGTIHLNDSPDQIKEKIKKALTDFTSDVSYNPNVRPGVSNLVNIHALVTGSSITRVVEEANALDTAKYKERVADAVVEHLRPIREKIEMHLANRSELCYMLEMGAERARKTAEQTMSEVKQRLGLGTYDNVPAAVHVAPLLPERTKKPVTQRLSPGGQQVDAIAAHPSQSGQRMDVGSTIAMGSPSGGAGDLIVGDVSQQSVNRMRRFVQRTEVPVQAMRVEKFRHNTAPRHVFRLDSFNMPKLGFGLSDTFRNTAYDARRDSRPTTTGIGFSPVDGQPAFKPAHSANPSPLASITRQVNAAQRQREMVSSLANSSFYKAAASSFNNPSLSVVNVAVNKVRESQMKSKAAVEGNTTGPSEQTEQNNKEHLSEEQEQEQEEDVELAVGMSETSTRED